MGYYAEVKFVFLIFIGYSKLIKTNELSEG